MHVQGREQCILFNMEALHPDNLTMTSLHSPQHSTSEQNNISNIHDHILSAALLTAEISTCIWIVSSPRRGMSKTRVPSVCFTIQCQQEYFCAHITRTYGLEINKVCNRQMGSVEQITDSSHICKSKYKIHELCLCADKLKTAQNFYVNRAFCCDQLGFSLYV